MTGSPPSFAYRRAYVLPAGYSVEFALDGGHLVAEWSPRVPKRGTRGRLLKAYRAARHDFFASIGVPMLVLQL